MCSPRSGQCCTAQCQLSGIPYNASGTYPSPQSTEVADYVCAATSDCFYPQYCIADPIFLGACPPKDWLNNPAVPTINITLDPAYHSCQLNGPPCYLFHEPSGTPCTGALCTVYGCDGTLCALFKTTNVSGVIPPANFTRTAAVPCVLEFSSSECTIACEFQSGVCVSTADYATTADGIDQNVTSSLRAGGTFCSGYTGKCSSTGQCVSLAVDNPIDVLGNLNIGTWLTHNWYIILAVVGGILLLVALLRVSYVRKKLPALRRVGQTLKVPFDVVFIYF